MCAQACLKDRSLKQHAGKLEVPLLEKGTLSYRGLSGTLSVSLIQRRWSATLGQRIDVKLKISEKQLQSLF